MLKALLFKLGYGFRVHRLFRSSNLLTVLCLHRVNPISDPLFPPLAPSVFAELIPLLKKEYRIVGIREWQATPTPGRNPILIITFDDGYKDFVTYAMPVIRKEKITVNHNIVVNSAETGQLIWTQRLNNLLSTLFRTSRRLEFDHDGFSFHQQPGDTLSKVKAGMFANLFPRPYSFTDKLITELEKKYSIEQPVDEMMNWDDVIACDRDGVEIGSHTMLHASLAEYHDDANFEREIDRPKKILEEKLGHAVETFAFPNGWAHPAAYERAVAAGYKHLLLIDGVKYPFNLAPNPSIHSYKRILVGHPSVHENMFNIFGFHRALKR